MKANKTFRRAAFEKIILIVAAALLIAYNFCYAQDLSTVPVLAEAEGSAAEQGHEHE